MTFWQALLAAYLGLTSLALFGMSIPTIIVAIIALVAAAAVLAGK